MLKKTLKAIAPPILISGAKALKRNMSHGPAPKAPSDALFEGDDALFKSVLADTKIYGEYGCGASTKWVLANTDARVLAVDTSRDWVNEVKASFDAETLARAQIHHVDLGPLGTWGRPVNFEKRKDFSRYTDAIWQAGDLPDTVLVDGRFRVCCFLTCLKPAAEGTRIIFDDYTNRPLYHVIEDYADRVEVCGRQSMFIVPPRDQLDIEAIDADIVHFRHVID